MIGDRLLSRNQQLPGQGPEIYKPSNNSDLIKLYFEFFWNHHDLIRYYQIVTQKFNEIDREIDEAHNKLRKRYSEINLEDLDDEEVEMINYQVSRYVTGLRDNDLELKASLNFLDNHFIIGLWALSEQFIGKTLKIGEEQLLGSIQKLSHRWDVIVDRFGKLGLDIKACKGYLDVDECRVLNNKIKHVGNVDEQLAKYQYFSNFDGIELKCIEFELQRYSNAVFEFVGNVMELLDGEIFK